MTGYDDQLQIEARRAQDRENSARNGAAFCQMVSTGQGPLEWEDPVEFGMTFVRLPWISCGYYIDADDLREQLDLPDDADPPFPIVSNYVTDWQRDHNGLYVGAWVGCRVWFPPPIDDVVPGTLAASSDSEKITDPNKVTVPLDLEVEVTHYFRFEAIAMKDVAVPNQ